MRPYFDLLLLAVVIVYIIDVSGVIESIKGPLSKMVYRETGRKMRPLRPFDCSLCMTWWAGIIYIIAVGEFSLPTLTWVAVLSAMSTRIHRAIQFLQDAADAFFDFLTSKINGHGNE